MTSKTLSVHLNLYFSVKLVFMHNFGFMQRYRLRFYNSGSAFFPTNTLIKVCWSDFLVYRHALFPFYASFIPAGQIMGYTKKP